VSRVTPFGLLLCELVTNSYKHAFDESGGQIHVEISETDGHLVMKIRDDGAGFDLSKAREKRGHIGLRLAFELAEQAGGELTVDSSDDGTVWTFQ